MKKLKKVKDNLAKAKKEVADIKKFTHEAHGNFLIFETTMTSDTA